MLEAILNHLWSEMNNINLPWANAMIFPSNSESSTTVCLRGISGPFKVDKKLVQLPLKQKMSIRMENALKYSRLFLS